MMDNRLLKEFAKRESRLLLWTLSSSLILVITGALFIYLSAATVMNSEGKAEELAEEISQVRDTIALLSTRQKDLKSDIEILNNEILLKSDSLREYKLKAKRYETSEVTTPENDEEIRYSPDKVTAGEIETSENELIVTIDVSSREKTFIESTFDPNSSLRIVINIEDKNNIYGAQEFNILQGTFQRPLQAPTSFNGLEIDWPRPEGTMVIHLGKVFARGENGAYSEINMDHGAKFISITATK